MRILGLDFGKKRIGVAVCDELGMTAQGLAVIERKSKKRDIAAIHDFVRTYEVEEIVMGYPLTLDGTPGLQCAEVDRFIHALTSAVTVPVVRWDESFSTKEAEEILQMARIKKRKKKSLVDKIAAGMILQRYLDSRQSGSPSPIETDRKGA